MGSEQANSGIPPKPIEEPNQPYVENMEEEPASRLTWLALTIFGVSVITAIGYMIEILAG